MLNNVDRAIQFQSFDALKGFKDALNNVEKNFDNRKELLDDYNEQLNYKLLELKQFDKVKILHYYNLEYIETIDYIKKIDVVYKKIFLKNCIINFDDIINIELV